jgi:rhodanese-related sulfurtransferase
MDHDGNLALVEVLGPQQYERGHLPGAVNVPFGEEFDEAVQQAVPDKSREVVVYCASKECPGSPRAGARLEKLGYQQVYDYEGGKADWQDAQLPLAK